MSESRPENPVKTLERAPEAAPAKSPPEQKQVGRATADHGGLYAQFRDLTAASGGGEPPPEKFAPLFRRAEYSHPANEAARARALAALQGQYGNRYVQRVLAPATPDAPADAAPRSEPTIQRQAASAAADGAVGDALDRSMGQPLDPRTADFMAARFGHDFSDVRGHTDSAAGQAARTLGAEAFTAGRDVYFSQGAYDPGSDRGRGLIAHELAHVVQHDRGLTDAAPHGFRVSRPEDPLERQAEAASRAVLRGELLPPMGAAGPRALYRQVRGGSAPATPSAPAAPAPGPAPASAGPRAGGAPARPAAAPRAGDFPISFAGSTLVLPMGGLLERAAPGGKIAVPDRIIKRAPSIPASRAIRPRYSGAERSATPPTWAIASRISTPGITG